MKFNRFKITLQRLGTFILIASAPIANAADITLLPSNPVAGDDYQLLDLGNNPAWSQAEMGAAFARVQPRVDPAYSDPALWTSEQGIYIGEGGGSYRGRMLRATWQSLPNAQVIEITGQIKRGDTERLRALVAETGFSDCISPSLCPYNNVISLNSPGGSLVEALALGEYIAEQNFATLLARGATCESACALAFLGGFTNYEGFFFPRRYVHETARLGVHRPYFELPDRSYSSDEVAQVVRVVNQGVTYAISYLLKVGIGLDFLQQMYNTPGDQMHHLAPLEMSAQQIFVLGQPRKVATLTRRDIFAYCANIYLAKYADDSAELLANLQTNGSAFLTFEAGKDFICAGVKQISTDTWRSHICTGKDCGLGNFGQNEIYSQPASALTPMIEEIAVAIDVLPVGAALREFRHRSALLRYVRLFAEAHDFVSFPEIPYAALTTPVPAPYCGQIDGYDPALVLNVQDLLNRNGISVGKPDGAAGPNTRRGIRQYNKANLGRDSDMIDQNLLVALGAAPDVANPYKLCP